MGVGSLCYLEQMKYDTGLGGEGGGGNINGEMDGETEKTKGHAEKGMKRM